MRRLEGVGLDDRIVIEEIGRIGVVGQDAADPGRRHDHRVGLFGFEKGLDLSLAFQIDAIAASRQDIATLGRQAPHHGRPDHPAMTGYEDALSRQIPGHVRPLS